MHRNKLHALLAALTGFTAFLVIIFVLRIPWHIHTGNQAQLAIQQLDRMRPPMLRIESIELRHEPAPSLAAFEQAAADLRAEMARYLVLADYNPTLREQVEHLAVASEAWLEDERALWALRSRLASREDNGIAAADLRRLDELRRTATEGFLHTLNTLAAGEEPIHADIDTGRANTIWFQVLSALLILFLLGIIIVYQRKSRSELETAYGKLKKARQEIDEREKYLSRTLDSIGDAVITTDTGGRVVRMNPVAEQLTGWTLDEARGQQLTQVFHIVNAHSRKPVDNPVEKVLREGQIVGLANHTLLLARDGSEYQIADSGAPIFDAHRRIPGVILVFRDVTREYHLQEEIRRHRDELEERVAERTRELETSNRELESFSYAVSHDLRAPLRAINGFAEALLDDNLDQLDATGQDYLQRVAAAARHMGELIDALLQLSRVSRHEIHRQSIDLSRVARELADNLQVQEPERKVEWQIENGLHAAGDPELLRAVLDNLLGNAWKYTRGRDACRIAFGSEEQDGKPVFFVRDNGCGFDPRYRDRLFAPFQRLHGKEFEGSGVGLATVYRIIRRHQGSIWAEGRPGEGATFYFTLPDDAESANA